AHREREAALAAERDRLARVLDRMVEGVLVVGADGRVARTNPALERLLPLAAGPGATPGEATGRHEVQLAAARAAAGETVEGERLAAGGRTLLLTAAPAAGGAVLVFHDVTELQHALEVRRDFVANASHELKTPVAAILAAAETLAGGALEDRAAAARFTATIERHARRLARLVEELLALSRLEAGAAPERRPVAAAAVVAEVCALMEAPFREAGLTLRCEVAEGLPPWRGDRRSLETILTNLLDNARAYTPEGGEVAVRLEAADGGLRLRVRDTGIGIAPEHQGRIFERFYRVDPARSRAAGGTGLGLALVKHLAESLGGRVAVESAVGAGSTFTVELPGGPEAAP
ncbi:MAG: PAS domain-containing sensor histidine kinase, partial [Nitrospirae bacterium]